MRQSEIASRYAKALFEVATAAKKQDEYLNALKMISSAFSNNEMIEEFIHSPLILSSDKEKTLTQVLKSKDLPEDIVSFLLLLTRKGRLSLLADIVSAYQTQEDELNKVTRGIVKSPHKLTDVQKIEIQKSIENATKKKVVLQYQEVPELIGGLFAQVGSLTFDDSLSAHLSRIKDDLTRRIN